MDKLYLAYCPECGWFWPGSKDKQHVETMANLHKAKTGHDVVVHAGIYPHGEVSGCVGVGKLV